MFISIPLPLYNVKRWRNFVPMKLPLTSDAITAQWLSTALSQRRPGTVVTNVEIVDVLLGTSTKIRVRPTYSSDSGASVDLQPTLIVKGGFEAHSPLLAPMYLNEMRFYRDVQPRVPMRSPICYFAGTDHDSHQSIVIMEDLSARGVEFCSALRPQSYDQVARRLDAIAAYHASTWNSREFESGGAFDWVMGRHENWSVEYQNRYLAPEVWRHYMESPRGAAVSQKLHDRRWMAEALAYLGRYHRGAPVCLCHGDTHLGNLYIDKDGEPGFFDAQVAKGPWQLEVTYHLIAALDIHDRRLWERDLLRHYLEALAARGVPAPLFDDAWEAHRREIAFGLFIFLINEVRFQTEAINTAYAARFGAAALDHDTVILTSGH
jgi:Ecdysteroid kinase-like family